MSEYYLMHYGILGQKWGVRRYQNEDGTLTAEGLARYKKAKGDYNKAKETYRFTKTDVLRNQKGKIKDLRKKKNEAYSDLEERRRIDRGKKLVNDNYTVSSQAESAVVSAALGIVGDIFFSSLGKRALLNGHNATATALGLLGTMYLGAGGVGAYLSAKDAFDIRDYENYKRNKR